jgi:hypothetical protein
MSIIVQTRKVDWERQMSGWLLIATGLAYFGVAVDQWFKGDIPMTIVYLAYTAGNAGFWLALRG